MPDDLELEPRASEGEDQEDSATPEESTDPLADDADLQQELLKLYQRCLSEDRYPRLVEVKDVWQAERYWQGQQYGWWSQRDNRWYAPGQGPQSAYGGDIEDTPRYQFVTNIYQSRGLNIIGAISGAVPRNRFFPEDADNPDDQETAQGRTKLAKLVERWNPPQLLLQEEAYHAYTGGFIAFWARYVEDGGRFGFDSHPTVGSEDMPTEEELVCPQCGWSAPAAEAVPPVPCPKCGQELTEENIAENEPIPVPTEGEPEDVPRGREIITVWGALNCKRPQYASHQSEYHYFAIEREVHYAALREEFPDKAEKIKPGLNFGADDVFERNARLAVAENTGMMAQGGQEQATLVTEANVWFRPKAFYMLEKSPREKLLELFPDGCRVKFGGTEYLTSEAEAMDDAIVARPLMPGRGQHRPAVGSSTMSVQDRLNTFTNIATETYEYGIPVTYRAADTFASEADDEQRAAPGLEVEVALMSGQDLRQKIMQVRADSVSPDMHAHMQELFGPISQDLSGAYPAVSGTTENAPDTLGQQVMQRDQSMGRMGVFYVPLKQAHADIMTLACKDLQKHAQGTLKIPVFGQSGEFESEAVDVTALEGDASAYPEGDENFPELWNQQRSILMQVADTPFGQQLAKDPGNAELMVKALGVPDLKVPSRDSWQKQLREIGELTKPGEIESMNAMGPMVEVDSDDDHPTESACCKWWMNSDQGQKLKRSNPTAWQAVKAHKAQHDAQIAPPPSPEKPATESVTINSKDMPPEAIAQFLEKKYGIQVSPQDFIDAVALKHAEKAPKTPALGQPPQAGTQLPPAAGVQ